MYKINELKNRVEKLTLTLIAITGLIMIIYKINQNENLLMTICCSITFALSSIISCMISDIVKDNKISSIFRLFTISMIATNILLFIIGFFSSNKNDVILNAIISICNINSIISTILFIVAYFVSKIYERKEQKKNE